MLKINESFKQLEEYHRVHGSMKLPHALYYPDRLKTEQHWDQFGRQTSFRF